MCVALLLGLDRLVRVAQRPQPMGGIHEPQIQGIMIAQPDLGAMPLLIVNTSEFAHKLDRLAGITDPELGIRINGVGLDEKIRVL